MGSDWGGRVRGGQCRGPLVAHDLAATQKTLITPIPHNPAK